MSRCTQLKYLRMPLHRKMPCYVLRHCLQLSNSNLTSNYCRSYTVSLTAEYKEPGWRHARHKTLLICMILNKW